MSFLCRFNRLTLSTCIRNITTTQHYFTSDAKDTANQENVAALENIAEDTSALKKGFAKAYESHSDALKPKEEPQDTESFASLLRNSKLVDVSSNNFVNICFPFMEICYLLFFLVG